VRQHTVPGRWPKPDSEALVLLAKALQRIPDGAVVLLDGLVASAAAEVLVPQAGRVRLVVLVHMPLGHRPANGAAGEIRSCERAVLQAACAVVTTSQWSRHRLVELYELAPDRLHVAEPGVDRAGLARGTASGGELLCVAAVSFEKGHDVLIEALLSVPDLSWRCLCVGKLDRDAGLVADLRRRARDDGIADRVSFPGPRTGSDLARSYAAADLLVLASRAETYGMVVTEALARGVPVLAADVGGVTEALGCDPNGIRPGLLISPGDPAALAAALRAWLGDAGLRDRLRRAARGRRESLPRWTSTTAGLAEVLATVSG
jgi:glycosyltransferase involved in cell wall biosynthesis